MDRPLEEQGLRASAHADTFILAQWTFDGGAGKCTDEVWTSHDLTAQTGCYFHIDDFAGLNGGTFGRLAPLEGSQSLWCGARPDTANTILCRYAALPGYGNEWDQSWCFKCIEVPDTEEIFISYLVAWDSEPGLDYTYLEYATKSTCDSLSSVEMIAPWDWHGIATFDGVGAKQSRTELISTHRGAIRIRFQFESDGGWSDQDGLWDTDGAVIIDSITVGTAYTVYDFEDFEDESSGDIAAADGDWTCAKGLPYGDFAGLFHGSTLLQEDPCAWNLSCMWAFIEGSTATYACGGHPEQIVVPYVNSRGQYIFNEIWSPFIDHTQGAGSVYELVYDVYLDLELPEMVFYVWHIRSWVNACPGKWRDRNYIYYGSIKEWGTCVRPLGDLIAPNASHVQLALGCGDYCKYYYCPYEECHTHSPLFDNVVFRRISITGPQWSVSDIDLFNDTFPEDGTSVGTGRIDAATDITAYRDGLNVPGDSAIVTVSEPTFGLQEPDPLSGFGSAAYFYLSRDPQSKPMPLDKIVENSYRWPVVDSVICGGRTWYQFRLDTVFTESSGPRTGPVPDKFCIDLNDHFFTGGDTLWFFFGATDANAASTWWSQFTGAVDEIDEACAAPMEMQILPGAGPARGGDILYVDQFDGRGAEPYFNSAFEMMGIMDKVDRFDKRGPSARVGNGVAGRVVNIPNQLQANYRGIIWCSGELSGGTVGDASWNETDDFAMLDFFFDQHPSAEGAGIYFSGDDMAYEWIFLGNPSSSKFISKYIPHTLVTGNHTFYHEVSPLVVGMNGGIFDHGAPLEEDTIIAYGGCPVINDFDQIQPAGAATLEMTYGGSGLPGDGAVVACDTSNAFGIIARVVLSGFSFHHICDDYASGIPDRVDHLTDIIRYIGNIIDDPTSVDRTRRLTNSLVQNYPNPFNAGTTIRYAIKEKAHVTLKIYDVTGRLIKILVDETKEPGVIHNVYWNGDSDRGYPVSSGVYFYKLATKGFTKTRKMVVLK
ncbi:MAG: T9SS type A sorting domain-containing protein [Candidatus Latescibacteria bacterium]|nr:T9SS type A sorting domain-containing protein [Candidatus Latescibacterota bacterium]NIO55208.1 T9SS type A sorting domain-containing protein [Candidatus Latescibacterota bacterium]